MLIAALPLGLAFRHQDPVEAPGTRTILGYNTPVENSNVTSQSVSIRPRTAADLDPCAHLLVRVHERDGYPVEGVTDPISWLIPTALIRAWVADFNDTPVGHVAISQPQPDDDAVRCAQEHGVRADTIAVLGRLFVDPDARGQRIGYHLARAAMEDAVRHQMRLVLDVMIKDAAAIHLYESLGWQHTGDVIHHYGDGLTTQARCYLAPDA